MATRPHYQLGQKGKGKRRPKRQGGLRPGATTSAFQNPGGVGQFPNVPPKVPNFLPNTPGMEAGWRNANDALSQAEGQYAVGQEMIPAQYNLQKARIDTDQGVATNRLNEDLAGRGVFTGKNAAGTYGGTSPSGGGIGETLYGRNVATPFGRQRQDLADATAGAYNDLYSQYGGANLGYNMDMYNNYLSGADEAYQLAPMGLSTGGYNVPGLDAPFFSFPPMNQGGGGGGGNTGPRWKDTHKTKAQLAGKRRSTNHGR